MRNISELSSAEKVQVHFMFREMKHGFVQIAKMYDIRATNVIDVVKEVDEMRDNHLEALTREPVVYRKHFVNLNGINMMAASKLGRALKAKLLRLCHQH